MNERYEIRGDVVFDHATGLEWLSAFYGPLDLDQALALARSLGEGWRLPTLEELLTLMDRTACDPASTFPGMPSTWFWSSDRHVRCDELAWMVEFEDGRVSIVATTDVYYVICVRGEARTGVGVEGDA